MKTTERILKLLNEGTSYDGLPFSWDVKIVFNPTIAQVRKSMAEHFYINDTDLFTHYPDIDEQIEKFIKDDDSFYRATNSMWESWSESDTYSMCSPDRLKRWGLPYGKDAPGVKGPFEVEYALCGRSSGHLVVMRFEGINLHGLHHNTDCLADVYGNTWLRQLGAMVEEWNDILHPVKVHNEFIYTIGWMLNNRLEDSVAA